MSRLRNCARVSAQHVALVLVLFALAGCGESKTPVGKNLLQNPSFEEVAEGVPAGWSIQRFKGLDEDIPAVWGVDEDRAFEGRRSVYFEAGPQTRGFFLLVQSIELKDVERIHFRGAVKTLDVTRNPGQYPQANFALTCYNDAGERFESSRFYDLRTQVRAGTSGDWIVEDRVFRLPENTVRLEVACALGMEGRIWFDDLSVTAAPKLPWNTAETRNFTFHWFAGSEYPEGSQEYQQELFDYYCARLGIPEPERPHVDSYFYPDSVTLYETIGVKAAKKSYWDEREVHSIYPVDDHEIIHIVTKPFGVLPFALTEGTAFYLIDDFNGKPVLEVAQNLLKENKLPTLTLLLESGEMRRIDPYVVAPAAAAFVGYLLEMGGPAKFLELHREANATWSISDFAPAFERAYGFPLEKAEEEWRMLLDRLDFTQKKAAADTANAGPR